MILSRLKNALNNNNGMALIVALCVATFVMALSLALVFSTAQISSNINNKLLREQAQQQASSFADILIQEMQDDTSGLYTAVNALCENSSSLEKNCDLDLVVPDAYKSKKYGSVKVTLCKTNSPYATSYDPSDEWQDYSSKEADGYVDDPVDYDVSVTVVVTMSSGIYATVTDTYERSTKYDYEYRLKSGGVVGEVYEAYSKGSGDTEVYFKRLNTTDILRDNNGNEATLKNLSDSRGDLGGGNSLVRSRVSGSGVTEFTFQGRE
jgi:hypothetical protein